jgi:hypothetical protein
MKIILIENCILEDDKIQYDNQNVLEITYDDYSTDEEKVVYYDIIDKRINTYNVITTEKSKITRIM